MNDLADELGLRYHRGLNPEVYYRCPSLESLDGALRNELEKNAASLIPVEIVTGFVFATTSTITVPVTQQPNLETLFEPADYPQSITVDHALCHGIEGKERLKIQRTIARCFIGTIQTIDGFKYSERQALNKEGSDGTRFKYVCVDSLQNRDRKSNLKKEQDAENAHIDTKSKKPGTPVLPTYDCGGAIHIKFSTKRDAVNVIYKHNPIHRDVETRTANSDSVLPVPTISSEAVTHDAANGTSTEPKQRKRKRSKKDQVENQSEINAPDLDMATSPETGKTATVKKRKQKEVAAPAQASGSTTAKKSKKGKQPLSPSQARRKAPAKEASPPPTQPIKCKCLRCREKGIKCNEVKPTCNQCRRGLWTCQYELPGPKKRSKNACLNCRSRKRKCTEEKPSCAHCLKVDDDCTYADYT